MSRAWTSEEVQWLTENISNYTDEELAKKLGRTVASVEWKYRRLGLIHYNRKRKWQENEISYLYQYYETHSAASIAKNLRRSTSSVRRKAEKLGLYSYNMRISQHDLCKLFNCDARVIQKWKKRFGLPLKRFKRGKATYYGITSEEFWKWAEKNKEIIPWKNYQSNSLPPEPSWVREAMSLDSTPSKHRKTKLDLT